MDYDSYVRQLAADSVSLDHAEYAIAEALCQYMNDLASNANDLYDQALEQRCEEQGRLYLANRQAPEKFPLELFTSNIKVNKFDAAKWNATFQDYLLKHLPLASSAPSADKEQEIMNRLKAVDQRIAASFPLKKDLPPDARLMPVLIPIAMLFGTAISSAAVVGTGMAVGAYLYNKITGREAPWPEIPTAGGGSIIEPPRTRTGEGSDGSKPPPPPPPPVPGPAPGQGRRKDDREKERKRKRAKDQRRRDRKDYYLGYVERVEPAGSGFEIRVEAIPENSLSDEVFLREIQKLAVAASYPGLGRYRLTLIAIFVHRVPPAVEVGKWINFKVDTTAKMLATEDSPDLSGAFTDGVSLLEALEPMLSFVNLRIECYFADNDGYIVQTDVQSITRDITASALALLQAVFSTFDRVAETIMDFLARCMNLDSTDEIADHDAARQDTIQAVQAGITLLTKKKPTKKQPRPVRFLDPDEVSVEEIKTALFSKKKVTKYSLYNVGQGKKLRSLASQQCANHVIPQATAHARSAARPRCLPMILGSGE
jgi:hypothetical protein